MSSNPPFRAKLPSDPDHPWNVLSKDAPGGFHKGDLSYRPFNYSHALFLAYMSTIIGTTTDVCTGIIEVACVKKEFTEEPTVDLFEVEDFDPHNPNTYVTHHGMQWIGEYVEKTQKRFVLASVDQVFFNTPEDFAENRARGCHACLALFDREKQEMFFLDPVNHDAYGEKTIQKLTARSEMQCQLLGRILRRDVPSFQEWKFTSIALALSSALRYVERSRPSETDDGYCVPMVFYHAVALVKYLPLLDVFLDSYEDEPGPPESRAMMRNIARDSAISTMVVHFVCRKIPKAYPPSTEFILDLFGFKPDLLSQALKSADHLDKAAVKFRDALFAANQTQSDKFSVYNQSCDYERQGWKNLTAFCETVLLDYFPRALVQYGCAPIYLWRWGRRPPDAPLANDGPMYLQTDGGDVNLYIMIREAANQKALAEARANKRFKVTKRAKATKRAKESDEEYVTEDEEDDDDE